MNPEMKNCNFFASTQTKKHLAMIYANFEKYIIYESHYETRHHIRKSTCETISTNDHYSIILDAARQFANE
jgi:hypothetical protein